MNVFSETEIQFVAHLANSVRGPAYSVQDNTDLKSFFKRHQKHFCIRYRKLTGRTLPLCLFPHI